MALISVETRKNLIHPTLMATFSLLRKITFIIMQRFFKCSKAIFFTLCMFIGEFCCGSLITIYHRTLFSKKKASYFMGVKLILSPDEIKPPDNNYLIYFYITLCSLLDCSSFILLTYITPAYCGDNISSSLENRTRGFLICICALLCSLVLEYKMYKHHICSLIIIFCGLVLVILTEIFLNENQSKIYISMNIVFMFLYFSINSTQEIIEKYILDYDFYSPFKLLTVESAIGIFIMSSLYIILGLRGTDKKFVQITNSKEWTIFAILLTIYSIFSGFKNVYKLTTIKLYSPMSKALTDSIVDPVIIICDFIDNGIRSKYAIIYTTINFLVSAVNIMCSFVYNEVFILYFCDLHLNTFWEISKRASIETHLSRIERASNSFVPSDCTLGETPTFEEGLI